MDFVAPKQATKDIRDETREKHIIEILGLQDVEIEDTMFKKRS